MKFYLVVSFCLLAACKEKVNTSDDDPGIDYSFFVAGHVYGTPGRKQPGIYPLFKEKFNDIKNDSLTKFGIFTGDIVKEGTVEEWEEVDKDIADLLKDVYFVVGNHDNADRDMFLERYGQTYYSFEYRNDLFIILDANIDGWNISGDQLEFLKQKLSEIDQPKRNIFVFFHQLLWWSPCNIYKNVKPNSFEGRHDSINFWSTVEPLFRNTLRNVVMFAGDVGAASWSADFMYDRYDNITLIASGMGEGTGDNFIIVDVLNDKTVEYRLVPLNCEDIHCLGKLEEFVLP